MVWEAGEGQHTVRAYASGNACLQKDSAVTE